MKFAQLYKLRNKHSRPSSAEQIVAESRRSAFAVSTCSLCFLADFSVLYFIATVFTAYKFKNLILKLLSIKFYLRENVK